MCTYWNRVSFKKSNDKKQKKIDSIGIGLASPEEIRRWGERRLPNGTLIGKVDKDHTVDYESLKPIEGGLFCERIFGPVEDFYCSCERRGEKNEKFCPTCEVEFIRSQVRRTRMGYIPLAVPVAHVWYLRGRPSYIANLIGKTRNTVDKLAYGETLCESFIDATYQGSLIPNFSQQSTQHSMESHECNVLNFDISNKEKLQLSNLISFASPLTLFTLQGYKERKRRFDASRFPEGAEKGWSIFGLPERGRDTYVKTKGLVTRAIGDCTPTSSQLVDNPFSASFVLTSKRSQVDKNATKTALVKKKNSKLGLIDLHFADNVLVPRRFRQMTPYSSKIKHVRTFHSRSFTSFTELDKSKGYKTLERLYFISLATPDNFKIFIVRNLHTWPFFYVQLLEKALTPLILKAVTYFSHQPQNFTENKSFINFVPILKRMRLIPQGMQSPVARNALSGQKGTTEGLYPKGKVSKNFELCYPVNRFIRKDRKTFCEKVLANTEKEVTRKLPLHQRHQLSTFNVNQPICEFERNKNVSINETNTFISNDVVILGNQRKEPEASSRLSSDLVIPKLARVSQHQSKKVDELSVQEATNKNQNFLGKYTKFHTLPIFSTFIYKEWSHRFSFLEYFIWSARENDLALPFYTQKNTTHKMRKNSVNWIKNRLVSSFIPQGYKESQLDKPTTFLKSGVQVKSKTIAVAPVSTEEVRASFDGSQLAPTPNPSGVMRNQETLQNKISTETTLIGTVMNSLPFLLKNDIPHFLQLRNRKTTLVCNVASNNILQRCSIITYVEQDLTSAKDRFSLFRQTKNIFIWESTAYAEGLNYVQGTVPLLPKQLTVAPSFAPSVHPSGVTQSKIPSKKAEESQLASALQSNSYSLWDQRVKSEQKYPINPKGLRVRRLLGKGLLPLRSKGVQGACTPPYALSGQREAQEDCSVKGETILSALKSSVVVQESKAWRSAPYNGQEDQVPLSNPFGMGGEVEDTQQFPRLAELLHFTGGTALRHLLGRFDLALLSKFLRYELKNLELKVNLLLALKILTYSQGLLLGKLAKRRSKQIRRLKLLELFQSQKSNPKWMILSVLPVLPPDLRPILRVNDDFVVASDLNRLYQTVLRRNNTIHERLDDPLPCPESGLFRQRSLQKAVDGLLENGKGGGTPLCASKRRPLVSLSHVLKGKKGLFRQHLLGKRVDYSGRSVIVVGPKLNLHECGLPKEMALELFQPFLIHRLKIKGLAISNTAARRMIQQEDPAIWHIIKQLVYEHPVLLNRAPTLHRLGIQAFQPRLVSGRAILLHPLVCNGFNADFDGDQMAVHVPLSFQARAEAWKIMWSKNNLLSPATGQPILVPSQDMVLGCYYLSVLLPRVIEYKKSFNSSQVTSVSSVNSVKDPSQPVSALQSNPYPLQGLRGGEVKPSTLRYAKGYKSSWCNQKLLGYFNKVLNPFLFVTPFGFFKKTQHLGLLSDTTLSKNMVAFYRSQTSSNVLEKNFFGLSTQLKGNAPMNFPWYPLLPLSSNFLSISRPHLLRNTNLGYTFNFFSPKWYQTIQGKRVQDETKSYSVPAFSVGRTPYGLKRDLCFYKRLICWRYPMNLRGLSPVRVQDEYTPSGCYAKENYSVKPKKAEQVNTLVSLRAFSGCKASSGLSYPFRASSREKERAPFQPTAFFLPKIWSKYRRIFKAPTLYSKGSSLQWSSFFSREMYFTKLKKEKKLILVTPLKLARASSLLRHGYQDVFLNNVLAMKASFGNTKKINIPEKVFESTNLINSKFSAAFSLPLQGRKKQLAPTPSGFKVYHKKVLNNCRKTFSESFGFVKASKDAFTFQFSPLSLYDFYICSRFHTPLANNMGISCSLKLLESLDALTFHSVVSHNTPNPSEYQVVTNNHINNLRKDASAFTLALNRIFFLPLTFGANEKFISMGDKKIPNEEWHSSTEKTNFVSQLETGHYFSSLQDSLIAYSQGRLQTHTPFWVRVNSLIINGKNEQSSLAYPEEIKKELQLINADKPFHTKKLVERNLTPPYPKGIYASFNSLHSASSKALYPEGVKEMPLRGKGVQPKVVPARLDKKEQFKETIELPFRNVHFDTTNFTPTASFTPRGLEEVKDNLTFLGLQRRATLKEAEESRLAAYPSGGQVEYNDARSPNFLNFNFVAASQPRDSEGIRGTRKENVQTSRDFFFGHAYTNVIKTIYRKTKGVRNDKDISRLICGKENIVACRRLTKLPQATQVLTNSSEFALFQLRYGFSKELCKVLFKKNYYKTVIETNDVVEVPLELRISADGNLIKVLTTFQNHYNCNATVLDQCQENCIKYMRTTAGRVVINEALFYTS